MTRWQMEGRIQRIFLLARAAAASLGRSRPPCARAQADTPEYTAVYSSFGGLYNRPDAFTPGNAAVDVTHASRTLLWLKPSAGNGGTDIVVMYDRATTVHAGKFKRCAVVAGEGWLRQRRWRLLLWLAPQEDVHRQMRALCACFSTRLHRACGATTLSSQVEHELGDDADNFGQCAHGQHEHEPRPGAYILRATAVAVGESGR